MNVTGSTSCPRRVWAHRLAPAGATLIGATTDHPTAMTAAIIDDVVGFPWTKVGLVTSVRDGAAYVDPAPGMTDEIRASLAWEDGDEGDYPPHEASIGSVTDEEIRLQIP